jgi:hypothetical protein
MNAIRTKLEALKPTEIAAQKDALLSEARELLATSEAAYATATTEENTDERTRLYPIIRSLKADIKRLETY